MQLDPNDKAARLSLSRALIAGGQPAEARKAIDDLKKDDSDDVLVSELDGIVARQQGRLLDAIAAFSRALALGDNGNDRRRLAEAQFAADRTDDAEATLKMWLAAHPKDTDTRKALAEHYPRADHLVEASEQFAELVKANPKNATAVNNLAWALWLLGRSREALDYTQQALALAPDSVDALDTLGTILSQRGIAVEAIESLAKPGKNRRIGPIFSCTWREL